MHWKLVGHSSMKYVFNYLVFNKMNLHELNICCISANTGVRVIALFAVVISTFPQKSSTLMFVHRVNHQAIKLDFEMRRRPLTFY